MLPGFACFFRAREPSVPFPATRLRPTEGGLAADDDYADPVAERHPEYAGRWLAGFAPGGVGEAGA